MLPREEESLDTSRVYPNPSGHFVIYVMKLQSQLMINVPLNIEVSQLLPALTNSPRCVDNKDAARFLNFQH